MDLYTGVALGVAGGIGWAVVGLANNYSKAEPEPFDPKRSLKTVLIGAITGGYIGYTGQTFSSGLVEALAESAGVTAVVNKIVDAVWNLISGKKTASRKR
jgi:hypothetical protein